jgi:hypothetical protein
MKTLFISSNTFTQVTDITKPFLPEDAVIREFTVENKPNHFGTEAWNLITKDIVGYILEEMSKLNDGDTIMYVDGDVLLLDKPEWFESQLGDCDIKFQYETGFGPNFGFFVARISPGVIDLMQQTYDGTNAGTNSQVAVKNVMATTTLKIGYFDTKDVWNVAVYNGGAVWNPGDEIKWPDSLKAFHANFTIGIPNKILLLNKAIELYA